MVVSVEDSAKANTALGEIQLLDKCECVCFQVREGNVFIDSFGPFTKGPVIAVPKQVYVMMVGHSRNVDCGLASMRDPG